MSLEELVTLRDQANTAITAKVAEQRQLLESELAKLGDFDKPASKPNGKARGPIAPKYRNPENPSDTWAGRGLKPGWLTAAIKGGKKLEDFAIAK
jgi:DNA-binding protein H-NS